MNKFIKQHTGRPDLADIQFKRIILTGFRATGKSLVGRILAKNMSLDFLDTDNLFVKQTGVTLAEFIEKYGWDEFRILEEKILFFLSKMSGVVIATGGGAILHGHAWAALRGNGEGVSIWLRAEIATIINRLAEDKGSTRQRPSLTGECCLTETKTLVEQRQPLYDAGSDMSFDTDRLSPSELADKIERKIAELQVSGLGK